MAYKNQKKLANFIFLLPAVVLFTWWVLIPFIQGIPISLTKWDGISPTKTFVGFNNYINIFTYGTYVDPLKTTVFYTVIAALGANLLGLLFALGIQKNTKFNRLMRTIYFLPFVISVVLCAYMWRYIYSDILYFYFHIKSPLGNAVDVIPALGFMAIWRDAGFCMILYLAAIKMIPDEYYEAAEVEGAGPITKFFKITMRLIVPAFTANLVLLVSWGLKQFDLVMAATGGGPGKASESLAVFVYKFIFNNHAAGYGQALAILFTIFVTMIALIMTYFLRRQEVEH
jgi:raffinose/stachyose/melibiose transport system permease protein